MSNRQTGMSFSECIETEAKYELKYAAVSEYDLDSSPLEFLNFRCVLGPLVFSSMFQVANKCSKLVLESMIILPNPFLAFLFMYFISRYP